MTGSSHFLSPNGQGYYFSDKLFNLKKKVGLNLICMTPWYVFLYVYDYRLYVGKVLPCFEKVIGF